MFEGPEFLTESILAFCGATGLARFGRVSRACLEAGGVHCRRRVLREADSCWALTVFEALEEDAALRELASRRYRKDKEVVASEKREAIRRWSCAIAAVGSLELLKRGTRLSVSSHALVVGELGLSLYSCGRGRSGQRCARSVSDSTSKASLVPRELLPHGPMSQVATGDRFSLVVAGPGVLYGCGDGTTGALGGASLPCSSCATLRPVPSLLRHRVLFVSAGSEHALIVVDDDRKLLALGVNGDGQLGVGDREARRSPDPVLFQESNNEVRFVAALSAGENHSLCALNDGSLYSWGAARKRQLGHKDTRAVVRAKRVHVSSEKIVGVAAGAYFSLALDDQGDVYACGDARSGALGLAPSMPRHNGDSYYATTTTRPTKEGNSVGVFTKIALLDDALSVGPHLKCVAICAGYGHALALDSAGNVYSWGGKFVSQSLALGRGPNPSHLPQKVPLHHKNPVAVAIAAGGTVQQDTATSLVTLKDGTVLAAGGSRFIPAAEDGYFVPFIASDRIRRDEKGALKQQHLDDDKKSNIGSSRCSSSRGDSNIKNTLGAVARRAALASQQTTNPLVSKTYTFSGVF